MTIYDFEKMAEEPPAPAVKDITATGKAKEFGYVSTHPDLAGRALDMFLANYPPQKGLSYKDERMRCLSVLGSLVIPMDDGGAGFVKRMGLLAKWKVSIQDDPQYLVKAVNYFESGSIKADLNHNDFKRFMLDHVARSLNPNDLVGLKPSQMTPAQKRCLELNREAYFKGMTWQAD